MFDQAKDDFLPKTTALNEKKLELMTWSTG